MLLSVGVVLAFSLSENKKIDDMKTGLVGRVVGKTKHINRNILYAFVDNSSEFPSKIHIE